MNKEQLEAYIANDFLPDIRNKIPNIQPVSDWQPIETAPKDGTKVLGYCAAYGNVVVMEWFVYHGCRAVWETVDGESEVEPTHWMPLPQPPIK